MAAVEAAATWYHQQTQFGHLIMHSDSTSAIARASHTGAGPGQKLAKTIRSLVARGVDHGRTAEIHWIKGHTGNPGNERADTLAGKAAKAESWSRVISISHLKLQISERYRESKRIWHEDPRNHGTDEIPPPPPKKSCMDKARNAVARTAAQIRTGHWRSVVYLKRIRKQRDDRCWICRSLVRMTRSHVLLHGRNERLVAARTAAWEGGRPGGIKVLLANPRWERRLLKFLETSGVG